MTEARAGSATGPEIRSPLTLPAAVACAEAGLDIV